MSDQIPKQDYVLYSKFETYQPSAFMRGSKFPLYWAESPKFDDKMIMKFYAYEDDQISQSFVDEAQFYSLDHENIISFLRLEPEYFTIANDTTYKFSYILMERAPYGDFADLMETSTALANEKAMRTYFHQLIEGLEYLHSNKIAHQDIKLENLLLGKDFKLKLCDFETSYREDSKNKKTRSMGTINYRAPEIASETVEDQYAVDLFSAGIVLFIMKFGILPYMEDKEFDGLNLFEMLKSDPESLWKIHEEMGNLDAEYDQDFKDLFLSLVSSDPAKRATIRDVKKNAWYKKSVMSEEELTKYMESMVGDCVATN